MNQAKGYQGWYVGVLVAWGLLGAIAAPCATAQITPDSTLGNEGSRVTRNVTIRGGNADRIDGGAPRGSNLFHSFSNFNVNAGQRVYFANPAGVQNILTRVTGNTASDIMGTLGVDGSANLFLLNPNGIIFGPNAQLDVGGSFTASTANSFTFPGGSEFSATTPGDGSLLSVAVPLGVQYGAIPPGAIANAGNLAVGQNLSLAGGSVTSTGQLAAPAGQLLVEGVAGDVQVRQAVAQTATLSASNNLILQDSQLQTAGDLNLLAGNTVQVRDSVANPFVAYAGGNLTVQGNQAVDIFALNHPSSGLVSGGDMVLRSANTVGGDAHYWTGGSFRIERLDGNPGNLFSPYDPIIRSSGDVVFGDYTGASLHIFAGGSVTAGNITITGGDPNGIQETVTLSNPIDPLRPVDQVPIDGRDPTLDIRAGTTAFGTPSLIPPDPGFPGSGNQFTPPNPSINIPGTRADIVINSIKVPSAGNAQVFLTNQYSPNSLDPLTGLVEVASPIESFASSVIIDSRGDITLNGVFASSGVNAVGSILLLSGGNIHASGFYSTGSTVTNGGPITFNAAGNIITTDTLVSDVSGGNSNRRTAGSINFFSNGFIRADSIIASNNIDILGGGNGGNITLNALYNITTGEGTFIGGGGIPVTAGLASFAQNGTSGDITLTSRAGSIDTTRGAIRSASRNGRAGDVSLEAPLDIHVGDIEADSVTDNTNDFNEITVRSTNGSVFIDNATLNTTNRGAGLAGVIDIDGGDRVGIRGSRLETNGYAGYIIVQAPTSVRIINSQLSATTNNQQVAPEFFSTIAIASEGTVTLSNSNLSTTNRTNTNTPRAIAGYVVVTAGDRVLIRNRSELSSEGYFGQISIGRIPDFSDSYLQPFESNFSRVVPEHVVINGSSRVTSNTTTAVVERNSNGERLNNRGEINITARDSIRILNGSRVTSVTISDDPDANNGGNINITTRRFSLTGADAFGPNATNLEASTYGQGNAGDVSILANDILFRNAIVFNNAESAEIFNNVFPSEPLRTIGARGDAGDITIGRVFDTNNNLLPAHTFRLLSRSEIQSLIRSGADSRSAARGNGGVITINVRDLILNNGSQFVSAVDGNAIGTGGDIDITTNSLRLTDSSLDARAFNRRSVAGSIAINTNQLNLQNSSVTVSNRAGAAGSLDITAGSIGLGNSSDNSIFEAVAGGNNQRSGGNITLTTSTSLLFLQNVENQRVISAQALGNATGGNVTLNVRDGFILTNANDNTDIVADAGAGNGGVITINTNQIFGFEERRASPLSDLDASSESGIPGIITLNTLNVDPTRGLGELPVDLVNTADLVADGCVGRNRSGVTDQGEFTQTGRGGLSTNPSDPLTNEATIDRLATLDPNTTPSGSASIPDAPIVESLLVEAQGLALNPQGKISLVSNSFSSTPSPSVEQPATCIAP